MRDRQDIHTQGHSYGWTRGVVALAAETKVLQNGQKNEHF